MTPDETDYVVNADTPLPLEWVVPPEGLSQWRAVLRVVHHEGAEREQTVMAIAVVGREGPIVRTHLTAFADHARAPARVWLSVVRENLYLMAATTGPALRFRVVEFGLCDLGFAPGTTPPSVSPLN